MAILLQLVHTKCWLHCVVTYVRVDIHWLPLPPGFLFLMELHWYGTNASKYPICTVLVASIDNNQLLLQTCSYATSESFFVSGDVSLPLEHYRIMSEYIGLFWPVLHISLFFIPHILRCYIYLFREYICTFAVFVCIYLPHSMANIIGLQL